MGEAIQIGDLITWDWGPSPVGCPSYFTIVDIKLDPLNKKGWHIKIDNKIYPEHCWFNIDHLIGANLRSYQLW